MFHLCIFLLYGLCSNPSSRASFYLAIGGSFSASTRRGLSFHFGSRLRHPNPHKVDDMVQIGEEVSAREPAVMAVFLNARLLETQDTLHKTALQCTQ